LMVMWTGWLPFDPILAILVALNILWSGGKLIRQSVGGLMDEADLRLYQKIEGILSVEALRRGLTHHALRARSSGNTLWVEFHLMFPSGTMIEEAHLKATEIEAAIQSQMTLPITFTTHLEPIESHDEVHQQIKAAKE